MGIDVWLCLSMPTPSTGQQYVLSYGGPRDLGRRRPIERPRRRPPAMWLGHGPGHEPRAVHTMSSQSERCSHVCAAPCEDQARNNRHCCCPGRRCLAVKSVWNESSIRREHRRCSHGHCQWQRALLVDLNPRTRRRFSRAPARSRTSRRLGCCCSRKRCSRLHCKLPTTR